MNRDAPRSSEDLRARPAGAEPGTAKSQWWQATGNETEDACFLVECWLDRELELAQLPLDVMTLATEQVQDVRLAQLETAGETNWPELLLSAFFGFMTNSPYGGRVIQLFTTRAWHSLRNTQAIVRASQTYTQRPTVEFFQYAGELYRYVPLRGTASPMTSQEIAELFESSKAFLRQGTATAIQTGQRVVADQATIEGITQGLSQSAVTLGQGILGGPATGLPSEDSPGVSLLDECMLRAAANRHLARVAAAGLIAQVRAGRVTGAQVAAQLPPLVEEDLARYRRQARLLAEAMIWVQLVPVRRGVNITDLLSGRLGLSTEASEKLVVYWRGRLAPLIAGSPRAMPTRPPQPANTPTPDYSDAWRAASLQVEQLTRSFKGGTFPLTFGTGINLSRARNTLDVLMLNFLSDLREDLRREIDSLRQPPGSSKR